MKNSLNPFLRTLAVIAMTQASHANTYYWDLNQGTANTAVAATGAWDGTNVFWNTDSTGGAGGTTTATVGNADDLFLFSGTSYTTGTISASGARAASSITFQDNVALTLAGAITIGGTGTKSGIFVASGDNAANAVTGALTLNGNNTIQNDGTGMLTIGASALSPSINGTGNLELKNNSSGAISLASTTAGAFNFTGSITNSGTGTGGVNIGGSSTGNGLIGSNVTSITQNSTTSALTVFGGNSFSGGVKVLAGTANLVNSNVSGGASGSITLGDTSGSAAASVYIGSGAGNATPITVQAGSSGVKTIGGVYTGAGGTTMTYSGSLTLNDDVTVYQNSTSATIGLVLSGSSISIATNKTMTLKNVVATASQLNVSGKVTGAGGVALSQGGATLSGINDYTGATSVNAGTLSLDFTALANQAGNQSNHISNSSMLQLGGGTLSIKGVSNKAAVAATAWTASASVGTNLYALTFATLPAVVVGQPITGTGLASAYVVSIDNGTVKKVTVSSTSTPAATGTNFAATATTTTTTSQTFNGTTLNAGTSAIVLNANSGSGVLANLGAISRNPGGGIVDFTQPAGTISATNGFTTSTVNINGIIGSYATVAGTGWATNNGTNIVALPSGSYTNDTWSLGNNTTVTLATNSAYNGVTTNSLRFNTAAPQTVNLSSTNTITSGGILVASAVSTNSSKISGGTIQADSGKELLIIQNNTGSSFEIASVIGDNSGSRLTKFGAGTLLLSNANTYMGDTLISNGKIALGNSLALQNSAYDTTGSTGAIGLDVTGFTAPTLGGLKGSVNLATAITGYGSVTNLILNPQSGSPTYSGIIANGAAGMSLTKTGAGTQIFAVANTYTGDTLISNGKIALGNALALQNSAYDTTGSTGAIGLDVTGFTTPTLGGLKGSVNLATAITGYGSVTNLTLNPLAGTATYSGIIANGASGMNLTKTGAGEQILTGQNSYTGGTNVKAGTLTLSPSGASVIGSTSGQRVAIASLESETATLNQTAGTVNSTEIAIGERGAGTYNLTGGIANTKKLVLAFTSDTGTPNEAKLIVGGDSALNVHNNGSIVMGTYYGRKATIIQTGGNVSLYSDTGTTLGGTGSLAFNGGGTASSYTLSGGTLAIPNITRQAAGAGAGGGTGTVNLNGGTLKVTSASFAVPTQVNINVQGSGAFANSGANIDTYGLEINFNAPLLHSGPNAIDGGLTKIGEGTLALSGASTYTGSTTVSAGTLLVNNTSGSGTGTGAVTVAAGVASATAVRLGGTGTISGGTTFAADPNLSGTDVGGIHSPGDPSVNGGVGKQSFTAASDSVTYNTGSIFEWNLAASPLDNTSTDGFGTGVRGTAYDAVNATALGATTGAIFRVVLNGTQDFTESFWNTNREWSDIFKTSDVGTALNIGSIFSGGAIQYYNGGGGTLASMGDPTAEGSFTITGTSLNWTAVPEPTSALAGILLTAGLLRRRRK